MMTSTASMIALDETLQGAHRLATAGRIDEAGALLDAVALTQRTGAWYYARGTIAVKQGQLATAVAHFERAVRKAPEVAEYRSNLGAALLEQAKAGDGSAKRRALDELELAVEWGPTLPEVHANLALARLMFGDAKGALAAADVGIRVDGAHLPSLYHRAAALDALGQHSPCLATLNAILAIDPTFAPALESRARTLLKLEQHRPLGS